MEHLLAEIKASQEKMDSAMTANREENESLSRRSESQPKGNKCQGGGLSPKGRGLSDRDMG